MDATFKLDGCTKLRIGNNISTPFSAQASGYIGLILEREVISHGPEPAKQNPEYTMLAALRPHEARAMASVLLSAATEARS